MEKAITILLVLVGLINFAPVLGVISAERVAAAYTVELGGSDLEILMRHRALMFGIVGGFILYAAFAPSWQLPAMVMAAVSMVGFLVLTWSTGDFNTSIRSVAIIDSVGVILLAVAAVLRSVQPVPG
jgi:hypothetical protein